jgi:hypothetical protein
MLDDVITYQRISTAYASTWRKDSIAQPAKVWSAFNDVKPDNIDVIYDLFAETSSLFFSVDIVDIVPLYSKMYMTQLAGIERDIAESDMLKIHCKGYEKISKVDMDIAFYRPLRSTQSMNYFLHYQI